MTPVKVKVQGNKVLVGFVEGVTILKNGVVVGDTHRVDFVEGNNVSLDVVQKGKRIQVKVSATGSGGGGGLNATVSGGVELQAGNPGNITLGGPLIRDVNIGGAGFGMRWGIPDSLMKFFSVFGNAWSMVLDDDRLYFKSAGDVGFEGEESSAPVWFNNFMGLVIGSDSINGSAILQLVSDSKAMLLNVLSNIANVNAPAQGMIVGSAVEDDVLIYWNNVWTGLTRPKIIITDDLNIVITEAMRNAIIIMTAVGDKTATWATGLSKGHTVFLFKRSTATGTIELLKGGNASLDAFNTKIYVGGGSIVHAGAGALYASGSLGPFVDAADIQAAIDAAVAPKQDILLAFAADITATSTLLLNQANKYVPINAAGATTQTIPPNSSVAFPIGTQIIFEQFGAGQATFAAGSGVTLRSSGTKLKTAAQYALCTLIKKDTNLWIISGDLVA